MSLGVLRYEIKALLLLLFYCRFVRYHNGFDSSWAKLYSLRERGIPDMTHGVWPVESALHIQVKNKLSTARAYYITIERAMLNITNYYRKTSIWERENAKVKHVILLIRRQNWSRKDISTDSRTTDGKRK